MNPYLARLREQYDGLRGGIEGLQVRAAEENRDLTDTELRSVQEQGEQAARLATQIEALTEIESRNAKVAALSAQVQADTKPADDAPVQNRNGSTPLARTQDRDPGHYRRGAGHSFFGDLFAARSLQDEGATRRLVEHNRALDMTNEGPGVIPPVWMASEFAELAVQQRRVANAVRNLPLANAAPISMPKQTASAYAEVVEQTNEGDTTEADDAWDSAVTTVSPKATAGIQVVTRQLLDSSNPAVDALIYGDLVASYNRRVEAKVVAAMVTAGGAATVTYATEAAWTTGLDPAEATYVGDAILDTAIAVRNGRKLPADVLICSVSRYGDLLKIKDSTGRPVIPPDSGGPFNVIGTGTVAADGRVFGLGVLASDGVTQYPESILVARASDTILFESPVLRFRYDEPSGPELIKLGIWAYSAVHVKYAESVELISITAAA